jgi:hypothetical protein
LDVSSRSFGEATNEKKHAKGTLDCVFDFPAGKKKRGRHGRVRVYNGCEGTNLPLYYH